MINEYLFLSDEYRAEVEAYKPDSVTIEISGIDKASLWITSYSLANKNEDSAEKLSEVHTNIMRYSPLVLTCESSEYYNHILFPLVNELERKLRKLLYLAASISDSEKAKKSIKGLEKKSLGEIFDLLFFDEKFILHMKERIDAKGKFNGRDKYSKKEIESYLDSLEEHTLWDTIFDEKDVPTLRSRFRDVRSYRNAIMHAHNIGKETFSKARYLFNNINKELDTAISKLIRTSEESPAKQKQEVNAAISFAMDLSALSGALKVVWVSPAMLEMSSQMSKVLEGLLPLGTSTALADAVKGMRLTTIQPFVAQALKDLMTSINSSAMTKALRGVVTVQSSPAMEGLRGQMSQISKEIRAYQQMFDALAKWLPQNLNITDELDDANNEEAKIDNNEEGLEEGKPNE